MAIHNTYTEEFDWFRMSPHHIEDDGTELSIKVINDYAHKSFTYPMETSTGTEESQPGESCQAFKNWKNINLALGPATGICNPVIVGQVRQNKTEAASDPNPTTASYFTGVTAGNFKSDGICMMPAVDWKPGHENKKAIADLNSSGSSGSVYGAGNNSANNAVYNSEANVVQFHVPDGLAPNTWMPLFMWKPAMNPNFWAYHQPFHWWRQGLNKSTSFWEQYATYAVSSHRPLYSAHQLYEGLRTCDHDDSIFNQYDTQGSQNRQNDAGSVTPTDDWSNTRMYYGGGLPVMWWYAHDGNENAMIISTTVGWSSGHGSDQGWAYNANWGNGGEGGKGGAMPMSSGCVDYQPPVNLPQGTSDALHNIQQWANDQRTTWVYKNETELVQPAWAQGTVIDPHNWSRGWGNSNAKNRMRVIPAGHLAEIIHGLTPFGGNADLSQPQNFYLHRFGTKYVTNIGNPNTSYKFGNLVKTHSRTAWYNGHGRGKDATVQTYQNNSVMDGTPDLSLHLIAKREVDNAAGGKSAVRINMFTCGGHTTEDGVPTIAEQDKLFFEFPGVGSTYGAVHKDSTVETDNPNAWTNIQALVDPTNTQDAVCKASGEENAVYVHLSGMTEGVDSEPDASDTVGMITITLGGTRKLVLGPQVLKCQLVENTAGNPAISSAKTIPGEGSDTLEDDITLVYQNGEDLFNCTYEKVNDAKIKIWVETPN